jgi:hypothetical protein
MRDRWPSCIVGTGNGDRQAVGSGVDGSLERHGSERAILRRGEYLAASGTAGCVFILPG